MFKSWFLVNHMSSKSSSMQLIYVGKSMLTYGLMPAGFFRDLQTVCCKMFIHLGFKSSNNSPFFGVPLLISCSDWPELHIQSEMSTGFFSPIQNEHSTKSSFFFYPFKPKIPDHKTAGHVNSRPIRFQSGCWCSRVIPAISTVRKCSVGLGKTDK